MAVLQGQDALNYLQQSGYLNPEELNTGQTQAPQDYFSQLAGFEKPSLASGLAGFGSILTQPFRQAGQAALDIGGALGSLGSWSEGQGDINELPSYLLSDQEAEDMRGDRVLSGIKSGVGIGAFAVPGAGAFGGGIRGAAAGGAIGGGLGGFAASRKGEELQGTLTGTVAGAGTGAALGAAGKAFKGLTGGATKSANQYSDDLIKKVNKNLGRFDDVDDVAFTKNQMFKQEIRKLPREVQNDVIENLANKGEITESANTVINQIGFPRYTKGGKLFVEEDYARNPLQRVGKDLQYDAAGIRGSANVNTLTFADDAVDDKRALDWAIKNTGLGEGPQGGVNIGTKDLSNSLDKLRKKAVNEIDIKVDSNDIFQGLDEKLSRSQNLTKEQARNLLRARFHEVATDNTVDVSGMSLDDFMNDRITVDEQDLFRMTQKLGKEDTAEFYRLQRHLTRDPSPKLEAGKLLDDKISSMLESKSSTIGKANRAFNTLYRQKGGFIQAYDRNANISMTGGKAGIMAQLQNPVQRRLGRQIERLGNLQARARDIIPDQVMDQLGTLPSGQYIDELNRLLPIYAGKSASQPTNINLEDETMDDTGLLGTPTGATPPSGAGQQRDPRQEALARGVLSGQIEPSRAKLAMQLLGIGGAGGGSGRSLPSSAVEKMAGAQASLAELDQLQNQVEQSGQFGPLTGGAFKDLVNDVPFLGGVMATPDREAIRTQTDMLALNMANALTTGTLSDRDIAMFKSMMPNLSDNPRVASAKINQVRNMLQNKIASQEQGYTGAGYAGVKDPAATPGFSDYEQMY